jgi:hypothetical protein
MAAQRTISRFIPHAIAVLVVGSAFVLAFAAVAVLPLPGRDDYNAPAFLLRHSWVKFAAAAASPLRGELSPQEEDARVRRYFELHVLIREQQRIGGDPAVADVDGAAARALERDLRAERDRIENSVERILEGRVTEVAQQTGLTRRFGGDIVWPPVSIEFEDPPAVLVRSPRAVIRRDDQQLLRGDLSIERVQAIERDAERDGATSALVVNIGGIAMYPAIIPPSTDYRAVLHNIAHEWLHHYLYFTPLGRRYYHDAELTTLNETVANMAGRELGDLVFERYPLVDDASSDPRPAAAEEQPRPEIDFIAEMRGLRREVEMLLTAGLVDEAEGRMEATRAYFAENGRYIRRINQAYFAFHGAYADGPGSTDPIGPKLRQLRDRSATVEEFIERARDLTSVADLDDALAR